MPIANFLADAFRHPLGSGSITPGIDGDGYYVPSDAGFNDPNASLNSYHLGVDWNGEGSDNSDLGDPVYGIANGTVVEVASNQGSATTGYGNHIVLRHDLPAPITVNGQTVSMIYRPYAHFDTVVGRSVSAQIGIAWEVGTLGMSGGTGSGGRIAGQVALGMIAQHKICDQSLKGVA